MDCYFFLRSCRKRNLPVGVTVYKINTEKICTYDLDDILIFYFDFLSFLQSDAGVETNLLMMFKVFIIFSQSEIFFSFKLMKAVVYFQRISKIKGTISSQGRPKLSLEL